jgi:PRTRC genetic system protein A
MSKIPIYLKSDPASPRPKDSEFFWLTRDGLFFCRNHPFFASDVPSPRPPAWLAPHGASCRVSFPKVPVAVLEFAVGFLGQVFERHGSEAVVLLLWNMQRRRYRLLVPEQDATVWESSGGYRSALDVTYKVPGVLPRHCLVVGDVHSHGDYGAYASGVDKRDERHRDGIHIVVGRIDERRPEFHVEMSVDGYRFPLLFDDVLAGYRRPRTLVPREWLDRVHVTVKRPAWTSYSYSTSYNATDQSWGTGCKTNYRDDSYSSGRRNDRDYDS